MKSVQLIRAAFEQKHGLKRLGEIHHNLPAPVLYEHSMFLQEAVMSEHGALVVDTTPHIGYLATENLIVEEPSSKDAIAWGAVNRPFEQAKFNALKLRIAAYLQGRDVYVQDCWTGTDPNSRLPIRIVTESAWQSLFARTLFTEVSPKEAQNFEPKMTILCVPNFKAEPGIDATRNEAFSIMDLSQRLAIIGGTKYAGEIKKSVFAVMNYAMPLRKVVSLRCSANIGKQYGDVALFFGLSGAGKTTLALDAERQFLGDDTHGWADDGIFNIENGAYGNIAKLSNVLVDGETLLQRITRTFGTIVENGVLDPVSRAIQVSEPNAIQNTRAAYPRHTIKSAIPRNRATHAKHIFLLAADGFGVLPPLAKLTPEQAIFYFLSGYGVHQASADTALKEVIPTFSPCFSAPFLLQSPTVYANLLKERIKRHKTQVWLVNTGWSGGGYGAGSRIKFEYTRALITGVLNGALDDVEFVQESFFHLAIPKACPNVPAGLLNPRNTWADRNAYDATARKLVTLFAEHFEKHFAQVVEPAIAQSLSSSFGDTVAQNNAPEVANDLPSVQDSKNAKKQDSKPDVKNGVGKKGKDKKGKKPSTQKRASTDAPDTVLAENSNNDALETASYQASQEFLEEEDALPESGEFDSNFEPSFESNFTPKQTAPPPHQPKTPASRVPLAPLPTPESLRRGQQQGEVQQNKPQQNKPQQNKVQQNKPQQNKPQQNTPQREKPHQDKAQSNKPRQDQRLEQPQQPMNYAMNPDDEEYHGADRDEDYDDYRPQNQGFDSSEPPPQYDRPPNNRQGGGGQRRGSGRKRPYPGRRGGSGGRAPRDYE